MSGVRPSSLPLAEHCGYSVTLSERYREGSEHTEAGNAMDSLIKRQLRGEIEDPRAATVVATLPAHVTARCDVKAQLVDPDTGESMWDESSGEIDIELIHDDNSLTIVDIKNGRVRDYDLQLLAYGVARALALQSPRFRIMPLFVNSPPNWPREWIAESEYWGVIDRIRRANDRDRDVPITGPHCDHCFRRTHCKAYVLPAMDGPTELEPFTRPGGLTADNAPRALEVIGAMEDVVEKARAMLKTFAREQGGIRSGGKVWGPVLRSGRRSISLDKAEAAGLVQLLEERGCISQSGQFEAFSWRNEKEAKTRKVPLG